jgi:hypothetical protein
MSEIDEIIAGKGEELPTPNIVVEKLKKGRIYGAPDSAKTTKQLDPLQHDVFDKIKRPDKKVKIDPDDPDFQPSENTVSVMDGTEATGYRMQAVERVALALQKLIVKRAVAFTFGNPVELNADAEGELQKAVVKAIKRVMYDCKSKSLNRKVARNLFSCQEVAEVWYPVEKSNKTYGFNSKHKLRCAIFSPLFGDNLYPYFDDNGDMIAFSREFVVTVNGVEKRYFETYTSDFQYLWVQESTGYKLVEGYPKKIEIGKIPVVYGYQPQVEWDDVQVLIDRLEKLLSNFADTNDYHAAPKIFIRGEIKGFSKKGESGAIIEGEEGSEANYLSWAQAPEAVKLEIDTLLRMIYTITQTPDISFESVKGIGAISGIALKLLFLDAHLKVTDHQEVLDEYLQRRINIVKAYIGKFNNKLASAAEDLFIEPEIIPYMIVDEAAEIKIWQDANGGNPVISQKASFQKAGLTNNPEEDYEQYKTEESNRSSFNVFEPTPA